MPFRIPEAIKTFDWRLSEAGIPLAKIITLGGVRYVEVCPACSCIHEISARHEGDTFEPRCLVREWNTANYQAWVKKYPDAAKHHTVQLVDAEAWAQLVPPPVLAIVKKPKMTSSTKPTKRTRKPAPAAKPKRTRKAKAA